MARKESPRARSRWMRRTTADSRVGGRPSLTPLARLTASASFVRCEISLRSNDRRPHHGLALRAGEGQPILGPPGRPSVVLTTAAFATDDQA
jgi:hypothetical protein